MSECKSERNVARIGAIMFLWIPYFMSRFFDALKEASRSTAEAESEREAP